MLSFEHGRFSASAGIDSACVGMGGGINGFMSKLDLLARNAKVTIEEK